MDLCGSAPTDEVLSAIWIRNPPLNVSKSVFTRLIGMPEPAPRVHPIVTHITLNGTIHQLTIVRQLVIGKRFPYIELLIAIAIAFFIAGNILNSTSSQIFYAGIRRECDIVGSRPLIVPLVPKAEGRLPGDAVINCAAICPGHIVNHSSPVQGGDLFFLGTAIVNNFQHILPFLLAICSHLVGRLEDDEGDDVKGQSRDLHNSCGG